MKRKADGPLYLETTAALTLRESSHLTSAPSFDCPTKWLFFWPIEKEKEKKRGKEGKKKEEKEEKKEERRERENTKKGKDSEKKERKN